MNNNYEKLRKRVKQTRKLNKAIIKWEYRNKKEIDSINNRIKEKYDFNSKDFFDKLENSEEEYINKFMDCLTIEELFSQSYYTCLLTSYDKYYHFIFWWIDHTEEFKNIQSIFKDSIYYKNICNYKNEYDLKSVEDYNKATTYIFLEIIFKLNLLYFYANEINEKIEKIIPLPTITNDDLLGIPKYYYDDNFILRYTKNNRKVKIK